MNQDIINLVSGSTEHASLMIAKRASFGALPQPMTKQALPEWLSNIGTNIASSGIGKTIGDYWHANPWLRYGVYGAGIGGGLGLLSGMFGKKKRPFSSMLTGAALGGLVGGGGRGLYDLWNSGAGGQNPNGAGSLTGQGDSDRRDNNYNGPGYQITMNQEHPPVANESNSRERLVRQALMAVAGGGNMASGGGVMPALTPFTPGAADIVQRTFPLPASTVAGHLDNTRLNPQMRGAQQAMLALYGLNRGWTTAEGAIRRGGQGLAEGWQSGGLGGALRQGAIQAGRGALWHNTGTPATPGVAPSATILGSPAQNILSPHPSNPNQLIHSTIPGTRTIPGTAGSPPTHVIPGRRTGLIGGAVGNNPISLRTLVPYSAAATAGYFSGGAGGQNRTWLEEQNAPLQNLWNPFSNTPSQRTPYIQYAPSPSGFNLPPAQPPVNPHQMGPFRPTPGLEGLIGRPQQ